MNLSPHLPPQHNKLEILWLGLNINLCHSRDTADSQAHRTVFCGHFGTHFAKYFNQKNFITPYLVDCDGQYVHLYKKFDRIPSRKGNIRHFIISTSVCGCAECACWAAIGYETLQVYILICYVTAASNGYDFKFSWTLGKLDLSWLVDLPKWGRPQLQQHNRVLAVAQTVLRHSLSIYLRECTSSWQESFTVDKFWSKSFVYSFTKTKGGITPMEGIKIS